MDAGQNERRAEARLARRRGAQRRVRTRQGLKTAAQVRKHLVGHAAGVDQLAVVSIVAAQERAEMRPRAFRVGPANDNELLAVEAFGFSPQSSVARRVGCADRFGDDALEAKFAGVPSDQLSIARLMAVELKARDFREQWLKKPLTSMGGRLAVSRPRRRRSKAK